MRVRALRATPNHLSPRRRSFCSGSATSAAGGRGRCAGAPPWMRGCPDCLGARAAAPGARLLLEPVAHAADGGDPVVPDLAAQVADVHVHDVRPGIEVVAPDAAQELLAAQHLPRMAEEHLGQRELACTQLYLAAFDDGSSRP